MMTLPLAELWEPLAQQWQQDFGWAVPWHFGNWQREYESAIHSVALLDLSFRTSVAITGRDRATFLHNFCTNDILGTPVGAGCEAFLTNAQAKILAWFHAFVEAEAIFLDADAERGPVMVEHLSRYQISEDVSFQEWTGQVVCLHVTGPVAAEKLADWLNVRELPLQEHSHRVVLFAGQPIRLRRLARLGQVGWDLVAEVATAQQLVRKALGEKVSLLGQAAAEVLRVEAGWPVFGRDLDATNLPQEVGRDAQAISFTKGCYLGQETVARIRAYGHVNRKLCGLRLATSDVLPPGTSLLPARAASASSPPAEMGRITSCVYSPRCNSAIALAMLRRGYWEPGTLVVAQSPGGPVSARVCSLPFFATTAPEPLSG